jgi:hypothetical protein
MAQIIATGKWSKQLKKWSMVVAIRRPGKDTTPSPASGRRPPRQGS